MKSHRTARIAAIGAVCVGGVALWTAVAQPNTTPPTPAPTTAPGAGSGQGTEQPGVWREKYREELRDHPRIARSIVALHETKEYLERAPDTFGGHKAAAIAACESAIKELKEAIKFEAKEQPLRNPGQGTGAGGAAGGGQSR